MNFMQLLENELNLTTTENGDYAYLTTQYANLDFFGIAGASRHDQQQVLSLFEKALIENEDTAIMNLFYLRDIRGGLGERQSFKTCYKYLCNQLPDKAIALFPFIVKYGRYDDLFVAKGTKVETAMVNFVEEQLHNDIENYLKDGTCSLLSKWLPSINASNDETRSLAKFFAKRFGYTYQEYRQTLSMLRKGKIIENYLREKDYSFDYETVPSVAMHKYRQAFIRNDEEHFREYLSAVKKGEKTIHTQTLFPYDIVREYKRHMNVLEIDAMQTKWDALERTHDTGNTIVVRDGSGSMTWNNMIPYNIATSLAILFSEQLTGPFKDCFITFSSEPKIIDFNLNHCESLKDKIDLCYQLDDYTSTDIEKVYNLIYGASLKITNPKDYIQRIVIISDMEFDQGTTKIPTYESMKTKFEQANIPLPEIVYWNVEARKMHFAARADQPNIRFVSGASNHIIDAVIHNKACDATTFMLQTLEKYKEVTYDYS